MTDLEARLAELRDDVAFPATPDIAAAAPVGAPVRRRRLRPLSLALALALAVAAAALALSPGARSAFLQLFRLDGATVVRVERLPPVEPVMLDLGEPVTRQEAERRVGFRLLDLGEPDTILVRGRAASLVYGDRERPRLVLTQLRASVWDGFVKKTAGSGTSVEEVQVGGSRGLFVSGDAHYVLFAERGDVREERTALAGNVLLWNRGRLLLRLEADVDRETALALADAVE